jgi:lipoprotein-releasing system permease protein
MLSLRVAARFLRNSPGQSLLIGLGIAVGIGVLIFVGSLISSFQEFLIERTLGSSAHVSISAREEGESLRYSESLRRALMEDHRVSAVFPSRTVSAIVAFPDRETAPLTVKSGEPRSMDSIYNLSDRLIAGDFELDGQIVLGKELAEDRGVGPGDEVTVILPDGGRTELTVTGVFDLGVRELNQRLAFVGPEVGRDFLNFGDGEHSEIEVQVHDVFDSTGVAERLRREWPDLEITDWQAEQTDLIAAIQSQNVSTVLIQLFVTIAVALGIASTLSVSAIQKTRQIGILKAMGMTDTRSGAIFLWEGLMLGLFGSTVGVFVGFGLIKAFDIFRAGTDIFSIEPYPWFIVLAFLVGLAVSMLSALLPSRRTARVDPIAVIQGE